MPLRSMSKGNLDLRHAARSGGDAGQLEAAQRLVIVGHGAFALQHMDFNGGLTVGGSGEYLALFGRNGGVAVDQAW